MPEPDTLTDSQEARPRPRSRLWVPAPGPLRWVLGIFLPLLAASFVYFSLDLMLDFDGFWRAGAHLVSTLSLSDAKNVDRYLPTFQVFMAPFGLLPLGVAALAWFCLNVLALMALPPAIERLSGLTPLQQRPAWLISIPFLYDNLALGQSGIGLLWLCMWALANLREGRALRGGAAIAAAAMIKIMPAMLLGVPLVLRRARGALLGFAGALLLGAGLTAALVGVPDARSATADWAARNSAEQSPWGLVGTGRSLRYNNQGLGVVLARTFGDLGRHEDRVRGAVRLAALPLAVVWTLYGVLLSVAALAGLSALASARRLADGGAWLSLTALGCLGMLLTSPLVWTHYFLLTLPAWLAVSHRQMFLRWAGTLFVAGLLITPLRALGMHQFISFALFLLVAADLRRRAELSGFPAQGTSARTPLLAAQPAGPPETGSHHCIQISAPDAPAGKSPANSTAPVPSSGTGPKK